jgi:hypothetical protein
MGASSSRQGLPDDDAFSPQSRRIPLDQVEPALDIHAEGMPWQSTLR